MAGFVRRNIVETQIRVNSKPFRLVFVHKGDTVEAVFQLFCERLRRIAQIRLQEIIVGYELIILPLKTDGMIWIQGIEALHRHPLLLRPSVIVLGLYLQEVETCIDIGTDAEFLAHQMSCLMHLIHLTVVGVEIKCIIGRDTQPTRLLHEIVFACQVEQLPEHRHRRDKLRVDAVHQPDILHILQRDGLKSVQNLLHITTL